MTMDPDNTNNNTNFGNTNFGNTNNNTNFSNQWYDRIDYNNVERFGPRGTLPYPSDRDYAGASVYGIGSHVPVMQQNIHAIIDFLRNLGDYRYVPYPTGISPEVYNAMNTHYGGYIGHKLSVAARRINDRLNFLRPRLEAGDLSARRVMRIVQEQEMERLHKLLPLDMLQTYQKIWSAYTSGVPVDRIAQTVTSPSGREYTAADINNILMRMMYGNQANAYSQHASDAITGAINTIAEVQARPAQDPRHREYQEKRVAKAKETLSRFGVSENDIQTLLSAKDPETYAELIENYTKGPFPGYAEQ